MAMAEYQMDCDPHDDENAPRSGPDPTAAAAAAATVHAASIASRLVC